MGKIIKKVSSKTKSKKTSTSKSQTKVKKNPSQKKIVKSKKQTNRKKVKKSPSKVKMFVFENKQTLEEEFQLYKQELGKVLIRERKSVERKEEQLMKKKEEIEEQLNLISRKKQYLNEILEDIATFQQTCENLLDHVHTTEQNLAETIGLYKVRIEEMKSEIHVLEESLKKKQKALSKIESQIEAIKSFALQQLNDFKPLDVEQVESAQTQQPVVEEQTLKFEEETEKEEDHDEDHDLSSLLDEFEKKKSDDLNAIESDKDEKKEEVSEVKELDDLLKQTGTKDFEVIEKPEHKGFFEKVFGAFKKQKQSIDESKTEKQLNVQKHETNEKIDEKTDEDHHKLDDDLNALLKELETSSKEKKKKEEDINKELDAMLKKAKELKSELKNTDENVKNDDNTEVCPVCHTPRKRGAKFCHVCGYRFDN